MEAINPTAKSTDNQDQPKSDGWLSCWGRLKLKLPWKRRLLRRYRHIRSSMKSSHRSSAAGFRYDPWSYAQNFDDQGWDDHDDEEDQDDLFRRGFSARFAAPLSKPLQADDQ